MFIFVSNKQLSVGVKQTPESDLVWIHLKLIIFDSYFSKKTEYTNDVSQRVNHLVKCTESRVTSYFSPKDDSVIIDKFPKPYF